MLPGLLQISLSCESWRTAELVVFYAACACQGIVADLFTREQHIIPVCKDNMLGWFDFDLKQGCRGGSAIFKVMQTCRLQLKQYETV